jgi:alanine-glyoxylate transaminase/serine-glyoxylate transaminase/serine-pyruvate transaminase
MMAEVNELPQREKKIYERDSRILHGAGPSNIHESVYRAMSSQPWDHLGPQFIEFMNGVQGKLVTMFRAERAAFTMPFTGTGTAGMGSLAACLTDKTDRVLSVEMGHFGEVITKTLRVHADTVDTLDVEWGKTLNPSQLEAKLRTNHYNAVWLVHGETSTGAQQPYMGDIGNIIHNHGALYVVDMVPTFGAAYVNMKRWGVDAAYAASQKGLGAPTGLAPIALRERALQKMLTLEGKIPWYFDISAIMKYWLKETTERTYHHTAPVINLFGLDAAMDLVLDEGLKDSARRISGETKKLRSGLEKLGFTQVVKEANQRMANLDAVYPPGDIDEAILRADLSDDRYVISGGLGEFKGKVVRVGVMGEGAKGQRIDDLLVAIEDNMNKQRK